MIDFSDLLLNAFKQAVLASHPDTVLPRHLPTPPPTGYLVIGAGKAAAAMAATIEAYWSDSVPLRGMVMTRHGHGVATRHIEVFEAGHPLPDDAALAACARMLTLLDGAGPEDHVLVLLSGGGSSLLTLPEEGLQLNDIRRVTDDLLRSGAPIQEINTVRKKLSCMLGGKLAARCRAPATVLIISDVIGDDPRVIASGPFHQDDTDYHDALRILAKWTVQAPTNVLAYLADANQDRSGQRDQVASPLVTTRIVATAATSLQGAADYLKSEGVDVRILGDDLADEARKLGATHAHLARCLARSATQASKPLALLSGGETTVRVSGQGRGGRNTEYLLSLMHHLRGHPGIHALAADTDGVDGTQNNAGAIITPGSWHDAVRLGLDSGAYLDHNDSYGFFAALDALVVTGPTRTNVNDFRAILIT